MARELVKSNTAAGCCNTTTTANPPTSITAKEGLKMQPTHHEERWLPIPGHVDRYLVSNRGRVRSLAITILRSNGTTQRIPERTLKACAYPSGHMRVALATSPMKRTSQYVHRLVMLAFVGPCPDGMEVRHLNGDPTDNRLENLKYGTRLENVRDMYEHGTARTQNLTHCPNGHEYTSWNTTYYRNHTPYPARVCLACKRARGTVEYKRNPESLQRISDAKYVSARAKHHAELRLIDDADNLPSTVVRLESGDFTISGGPGGDRGVSLTDADIDDEETSDE